ncbi:MAG: hypothetical protein DHS20C11_28240 [Lysobacteraceae bacterium]|nr:MAG: hypothetical protein DHS20C11_28240 [Xanthomonadaceae bacterium]
MKQSLKSYRSVWISDVHLGTREALINSNAALLDLKRAAARRIPQAMAVVLGKEWNNADGASGQALRGLQGSPHSSLCLLTRQ